MPYSNVCMYAESLNQDILEFERTREIMRSRKLDAVTRQSTLIQEHRLRQFLAQKFIVTFYHSTCCFNLAPYDFYLSPKFKISMRRTWIATRSQDIPVIQTSMSAATNEVPKQETKTSFIAATFEYSYSISIKKS